MKNIKCITTNYETQRFWQESSLETSTADMMKAVCVYPECTYQEIKGFGGAFTEASAYNLTGLTQEVQEKILEAYFGEEGLQYNLCRTHINSCDFALGNYAYLEQETDGSLSGYSIERDEKYLIPMITRAMAVSNQEITLLASPWSPPAYMKTNGEMNHGGSLKKEYYSMWADYIVRYIQEYEKKGIHIRMLTVQNEPQASQSWDSCIYSSEEEMVFVRDHLGPALEKNHLSHVGILVWDHNKEILFERASEIFADKEAANYIKGVAFHWYSGDHFEAVALTGEKFPDKELYFTEGCVEYSRFMDSDETGKAEMYAHDILGNLNAGMNGYMDWNLLLDEKGGPNHVQNYCAAPIMCSPTENWFEKRLSYYYIGHFSKYISKGAKRMAVSRYTGRLETAGFVNPDGSRVLVMMNPTNESIPCSLREYQEAVSLVVEPHSIQTLCYEM